MTGISILPYIEQLRELPADDMDLLSLCFFNALQRNLSQEQLDIWERETSWAESAGDEEGFEDSL